MKSIFDEENWKKINFLNYAKEINKKFLKEGPILFVFDFNNFLISKKGKLSNIPFAIKDNYSIKNVNTTAGTILLDNFRPLNFSTVFKKLLSEGSIPLFKANLDELAMGWSGMTSHYKEVNNPFDKNLIIGGSSSGSAYLVAKDIVPFSLGSDTGDSVRKPAVYGNVIGFKPTWGLVSRYGLFDFAPSWDTVGWFTKTIEQSALLLDILKGYDSKDQTSKKIDQKFSYFKNLDKDQKNLIVGYFPEILDEIKNQKIKETYILFLNKYKQKGYKLKILKANFELLSLISIVYDVVSSTEALSCNSNLQGFLFGNGYDQNKNYLEAIKKARGDNFVYEVKKRFLFAAYSISKHEKIYNQARRIRHLINKELDKIFEQVDALVLPAVMDFAPNKKTAQQNRIKNSRTLADNFLTLFNSNGSPSLSFPITNEKSESVFINIATKPNDDLNCFRIAKIFERLKDEK
ncbi:amidase family protein [Candidatus Hepatoplasma crinochetorum]|uniref:amidase family protein n=1 Tax=Candidatus Hepatoplasma crinochetorum TaxID=295596 RepID=UPI003085743A|nr:MAG: aspartyl/glutamyl-tRNA amidotransferase subunit A [Candidatus Hepatoplasma crinochetorum]